MVNIVCTGPATGTIVALTASDGPMTVSVAPFDVPPPGAGVTTVIVGVPPLAISLARIVAVSDVALPTVVARGLPFTCTTDVAAKFVPVTVTGNAAPPAATLDGLIVVIVGAAGGVVMVSVDAVRRAHAPDARGRIHDGDGVALSRPSPRRSPAEGHSPTSDCRTSSAGRCHPLALPRRSQTPFRSPSA